MVEDQFGLVEVCPCDSDFLALSEVVLKQNVEMDNMHRMQIRKKKMACLMQPEREGVFLIVCMRVSE